jgi:hypothetical protein
MSLFVLKRQVKDRSVASSGLLNQKSDNGKGNKKTGAAPVEVNFFSQPSQSFVV